MPAHAVTQLALTSAAAGPDAPLHPLRGPRGFEIGAVATFSANETIENAVQLRKLENETKIGVRVLNLMTQLGRPRFKRTA